MRTTEDEDIEHLIHLAYERQRGRTGVNEGLRDLSAGAGIGLVPALARGVLGEDPIVFDRQTYLRTIDISARLFGLEERESITQALCQLLNQWETPHLVVIGCDRHLLDFETLFNQFGKPLQLTIVDPSEKMLARLEQKLSSFHEQVLQLNMVAQPVQVLDETMWQAVFGAASTLVYANFSLHYLNRAERDEILQRFAQCQGLQLLVLERDLEMLNCNSLVDRIWRLVRHYRPHFERVSRNSQGSDEERELMQRKLTRLIFDALNPGPHMVFSWQCEAATAWADRFARVAFPRARFLEKMPMYIEPATCWPLPLSGYGPVKDGYLFLLYMVSGEVL